MMCRIVLRQLEQPNLKTTLGLRAGSMVKGDPVAGSPPPNGLRWTSAIDAAIAGRSPVAGFLRMGQW
ncbi:MAG: hypothetical protein WDO73_03285 [Ignavibacteriota bacterium]